MNLKGTGGLCRQNRPGRGRAQQKEQLGAPRHEAGLWLAHLVQCGMQDWGLRGGQARPDGICEAPPTVPAHTPPKSLVGLLLRL